MTIRRVYVTYNVSCSAQVNKYVNDQYVGPGARAGDLAGIRFRIFAQTNFPSDSSTIDPFIASGYSLNYPIQTPLDLTPSGTVVFDQTGIGPAGLTLTGEAFTFEGPPETNIAFIPVVDNIPAVDADNNYVVVDFRLTASQINVHYAEGQNDTPTNLHNPSVTSLDAAA